MRLFILLLSAGTLVRAASVASEAPNRFPDDFLFGTATASYQVEGGWDADGKGPSIWDTATHDNPELFNGQATGDVACDSYNKYKEDVQLLKTLGVSYYRFSISWPRILPNGKADEINQAGIDYYNALIDELLANGIEPYVTMFHWDLPQALQDEGGWPERQVADHFVDYARILFENFGDRVKHWMTLNEIMSFCEYGYGGGNFAPFVQQPGVGDYQCAHTALLAHGRTYRLYESEFRSEQNGVVGIAIDTAWMEPRSESAEDHEAAERALQMGYGWYINPIVFGNYPDVMIERIAELSEQEGLSESRLPAFTDEEQEIMKGSFDFIGLNHYTTNLVYMGTSSPDPNQISHWNDVGVVTYADPSWPGSASSWLKVVPWGINKLLVWIKNTYNNPAILVTESGFSDKGELEDRDRADYYKQYLNEVLNAIVEGEVNVIGYTAWSLMDNFEWMEGYSQRFGLHYVDFEDPERPRTRKLSSYVYQHIIETREVDLDYYPDWPPAEN